MKPEKEDYPEIICFTCTHFDPTVWEEIGNSFYDEDCCSLGRSGMHTACWDYRENELEILRRGNGE